VTDPQENGSSAAINPDRWVKDHGDYLHRFAVQRVRDPAVAEDILQETFLAALRNRHQFAGHSSERTWLAAILKRKVVDHFRRASREVDFNLQDPSELPTDEFHASGRKAHMWTESARPADWTIDPHDPAEQKEFWHFLNLCLDSLDQRMGIVFVLREMEEMSTDDICNVLGLSATNLRVILYRVRRLLRACIEKHWLEVKRPRD
jgi:RNA polymerase sigma-70 factor (ECF subfamily)